MPHHGSVTNYSREEILYVMLFLFLMTSNDVRPYWFIVSELTHVEPWQNP